jgi:hypothetical protein
MNDEEAEEDEHDHNNLNFNSANRFKNITLKIENKNAKTSAPTPKKTSMNSVEIKPKIEVKKEVEDDIKEIYPVNLVVKSRINERFLKKILDLIPGMIDFKPLSAKSNSKFKFLS